MGSCRLLQQASAGSEQLHTVYLIHCFQLPTYIVVVSCRAHSLDIRVALSRRLPHPQLHGRSRFRSPCVFPRFCAAGPCHFLWLRDDHHLSTIWGRCASVSQTDRPTSPASMYETRKTKKNNSYSFSSTFFLHCIASHMYLMT